MRESVRKEFKKIETEFNGEICWPNISTRSTLTEEFIREFEGKVDWFYITISRNSREFSLDFIYDFCDKLDIDCLKRDRGMIKKELKEIENKNKINSRFEILDL